MTENEFNDMKDGYIKLVKGLLVETGGLEPSITILGTHKVDQTNAIVHVPIPGKYMKSEDMKDQFVDVVIPEISEQINKKFEIKAVAWASEAWVRTLDKDKTDPTQALRNWKELPIQMEVLIVTIESADKNETIIMEISRKGKQVNEDGELVDAIELTEHPEYKQGVTGEGRFTGLYKKFVTL
jgi:uncharacterized membrane protein YvbJ